MSATPSPSTSATAIRPPRLAMSSGLSNRNDASSSGNRQPSSPTPSQSSSWRLQSSGAPGNRAALVSSQSVASATNPPSGAHRFTTSSGSPNPSPSSSAYQSEKARPSSTARLQSLSTPSQ